MSCCYPSCAWLQIFAGLNARVNQRLNKTSNTGHVPALLTVTTNPTVLALSVSVWAGVLGEWNKGDVT